MTQKMPRETLLDSALLITVATGVCYVLGFLAQTRRGPVHGIPWDLLPDLTLHQTLAVGALYLLFYLAIGLFVYLLWFYLDKRIKWLGAIRNYFRDRSSKHRIAFWLFLGLIGATILLMVPLYVQSPSIARRILQTKNLPKVIELHVKNHPPVTNADSLKYISRKKGIVVFVQLDKKRLILIREEDIDKLIIEIPEK